jgi:hypothetical protein
MDKEERIKHPSESAWVSYISPFMLIVPDGEEPLKVDIKEINSNTYDHGKLCRIVAKVTIKSFDFKLLICYDGAMAIPKLERFSEKEKAVDFFNDLFCRLLIGGLFCEAVDQRDIVSGSLHQKNMIWPVDFGESASTFLHSRLRLRVGNNFDSIILSNPKHIYVSDFNTAVDKGIKIMAKIDNLTSKFLIRGITEIKYNNWDQVLSNLWITVEQLTDYVWDNHFIKSNSFHPKDEIDGRIKSMKEDNRTWSTSVKQELLFQNKILTEEIISRLHPARKARNKLVHEGKNVTKKVAIDLFDGVKLMLQLAYGNDETDLLRIPVNSYTKELEKGTFDRDLYKDWKEL